MVLPESAEGEDVVKPKRVVTTRNRKSHEVLPVILIILDPCVDGFVKPEKDVQVPEEKKEDEERR